MGSEFCESQGGGGNAQCFEEKTQCSEVLISLVALGWSWNTTLASCGKANRGEGYGNYAQDDDGML